MLKGENIIVFSSADWKTPRPTSPQHLSLNFAEENKVLYIETLGSRQPALEPEHIKRIGLRISNWFKGINKKYVKKGELYIYSPIALAINFKFFLFINRLFFLSILKNLIKKLKMQNPVLIFYIPPPFGIIEKLNAKAVIYYCIDEWATYPAGKSEIFMAAEKKLTENADLVLVASDLLFESKKKLARRIHKIYHGVDYQHFTKEFTAGHPLPDDIKNIPKPIIAVVGSITDWIDLDLIKLAAQSHKEWSMVSIGAVDSNIDITDLTKTGNIYFLGPKDYSELPNYYRSIDVFIIPFLLNEHIKYCAPTRIYEHLSSGKPIVTTDFPAAHQAGEGFLYISGSREDFVKKIEDALKEDGALLIEKRKALAKKNTWRSRIEEISEIIEGEFRKKEVTDD